MSRYKKIITGETTLPEIDGVEFIIYPTIQTRMNLLEHIKSTQVIEEYDEKDDKGRVIGTRKIRGKYFDLPGIAKTCAEIIYEGCWEHDPSGKRTALKEDEADTTSDDILNLVLQSDILSIYLEIITALNIIDKKKADEMKQGQGDAAKKP